MDLIPQVLFLKDRDNVDRKIPQFVHQRRKLYKNFSPEVKMRFCYKNKLDGTIEIVDCHSTPSNQYQRNPNYEKLYEEAYVEVIILISLSQE